MSTTVTEMSSSVSSTQTFVEDHPHSDRTGTCPFTAPTSTTKNAANAWCPQQTMDLRSPCPALNTLANHGYINRSGKNIYLWDIAMALYRGYALTLPFAIFLCIGTLFLIKQWNPFAPLDLARLGVRGGVEHPASLVHEDVKQHLKYGSEEVSVTLLQQLKEEVEHNGRHEKPVCVDALDVARARIRRERDSAPIDSLHQEIARGEMAIALLMWDREKLGKKGNAEGIPLDWLIEWLGSERLPAEWMERLKNKAIARVGLIDTAKRAKLIRKHVEGIRSGAVKH